MIVNMIPEISKVRAAALVTIAGMVFNNYKFIVMLSTTIH